MQSMTICLSVQSVYNQRFRVFNKQDQFALHLMNGSRKDETRIVYKQMFNSSVWDINEYEAAHCIYSDTINHLILGSQREPMFGEWFTMILTHLFHLYNYSASIQSPFKLTDDVEIYLFLEDQMPLLSTHHLFIQPFTRYQLQHFTDLFERFNCKCYHRLIFCAFNQIKHANDDTTYLQEAKVMDNTDNIQLFPEMIEFYNDWINKMDINIDTDIFEWKRQLLIQNNVNIQDDNQVSNWRFIGFYQHNVRRKWLNLNGIITQCNGKYNQHKIFCFAINLDNHLHPRDIVIIHRSCAMLIGINGAHLINAVWMFDSKSYTKEQKYLIELTPAHSLNKPTALGKIFWRSTFNHIGFKLDNDSLSTENLQKGKGFLLDFDFKVNWKRLSHVIDYLLMTDEGFCNRLNEINVEDIKIASRFKRLDIEIAIHNAYCPYSNHSGLLNFCVSC